MKTFILALAAAITLVGNSATAATIDLHFIFSGTPRGNTSEATGTVSMDDSLLNTGFFDDPSSSALISSFEMTVTGAPFAAGNGTFSGTDLTRMQLTITGPLDTSADLALQSNLSNFTLSRGITGNANAPETVSTNLLGTGGGIPFNYMELVSLTVGSVAPGTPVSNVSPVPLPASLPLLAVALGGFGLAARRKKTS